MKQIKTLDDVSSLYRNGINICIGCIFEHNASCTQDRIETCNKQLSKNLHK